MLYNLIAINKYGEEIKLNESPLSMEEIIADDIEETRRVFAKPSMGKCRVEIVPVREHRNMLSNMVEIRFLIGNKETEEIREGSFSIDSGTARRYAADNNEDEKLKLAAKIESGMYEAHTFGFYISDSDCEKLGIQNDPEFSYDDFKSVFLHKFFHY